MKTKQFVLDEQIILTVNKRSSSRKVRLTIASNGEVKASIPTWLPYKAAVDFARSKLDWIKTQRPNVKLLEDAQQIGKNHHLVFKSSLSTTKPTSRVTELEAIVFYPPELGPSDPVVQAAAKKVAKRALLAQAKRLLPIRLEQLATKYGYEYNVVKIKSLKSRWGSCDSHKNITLNLYLMELPWELIDYVLIHELNHTIAMHHGPKFWAEMDLRLKNVKELRRELKKYKAII